MRFSDIAAVGEMMWIQAGGVTARTKLEDIIGGDRFSITHPTYRLLPLTLTENEPVDFMFNRENGMYKFSAVFEKRVICGNVRFCIFRVVSEVERYQRRYGYRLPIVLDAVIDIDQGPDQKVRTLKAKTVNISVNGVLLSAKEPIVPETTVSLRISLRYNEVISLTGRVVRVDAPVKRSGLYGIAVAFVDMVKAAQTRLGRFILQRQIIMRQSLMAEE